MRINRGYWACFVATGLSVFALRAGADESHPTTADQQDAAAAKLGETSITLRGNDLPLGIVISQIARSAHLSPVLDKDVQLDARVANVQLDATPLDAALAILLTPQGYSYEVDAQKHYLRVFVYSTHTFKVSMPAVQQNWVTNISNVGGASGGAPGGAAGASSAGGLGARIALSTTSETTGLWDEVDKSMQRLLYPDSPSGGGAGPGPSSAGEGQKHLPPLGSFSINRVAGLVTVRALPTVMPTVESYFSALNEEMGRTVTVEVKLMEVDLNTDRAAGIDWNQANLALAAGKVFTSSISTLASTAANSIFNGSQAGAVPTTLQISGRAGSALIRALEQQGRVRVMAQPTLTLGNNLPAVVELAELTAYVSQIQQTALQAGVSQITVETSSVSDGLMISVMPRIINDQEVSLALGLIDQDLLGISNYALPSNGGSVELPHTLRRSYSGIMRAKLNQTLVLGGLITDRKEKDTSGIPYLSRIPFLGWLFGTNEWIDKRSELVITMTPREIEVMAPTATPHPLLDEEKAQP